VLAVACAQAELKIKVYFLLLLIDFAQLGQKFHYHCELHTTEFEMDLNYQQLRLRFSH